MENYLNTGQHSCYDSEGRDIPCAGSGQDADYSPGRLWGTDRFAAKDGMVADSATGLVWTRNANPGEFPLTWGEALAFIKELNEQEHLGFDDWRLPNRRELRSLISHQTRVPALPEAHPFEAVFRGWYWTGTTAAINPAFAWYVHTEGGRMFYGRKTQNYLVWPVRGDFSLPRTGQSQCFDTEGAEIEPDGSGQDGEMKSGLPWPEPRFELRGETVLDRLTQLVWTRCADIAGGTVAWDGALAEAGRLRLTGFAGLNTWRLPTINELESLVDASRHTPALSDGHPFTDIRETYASSTTSGFETDWCMVLHMFKGAVGVGWKSNDSFSVWAVAGL